MGKRDFVQAMSWLTYAVINTSSLYRRLLPEECRLHSAIRQWSSALCGVACLLHRLLLLQEKTANSSKKKIFYRCFFRMHAASQGLLPLLSLCSLTGDLYWRSASPRTRTSPPPTKQISHCWGYNDSSSAVTVSSKPLLKSMVVAGFDAVVVVFDFRATYFCFAWS